MRGRHGSASMSATEWIGSSQVIRSRWRSSMLRCRARGPDPRSTRRGAPRSRGGTGRPPVHRHGEVAVVALQVDDVDAVAGERARATKPSSQLGVGSSLKRSPGSSPSQREQDPRLGGSPIRTDATKLTGPRRTADGVLEREAVLAQGEVERRALERPPAVEARAVADRLDREEVGQAEQPSRTRRTCGSRATRSGPPPRRNSIWSIWSHVMSSPSPTWPPPLESHDDRDLGEAARRVAHEGQQLAALDASGSPATCA